MCIFATLKNWTFWPFLTKRTLFGILTLKSLLKIHQGQNWQKGLKNNLLKKDWRRKKKRHFFRPGYVFFRVCILSSFGINVPKHKNYRFLLIQTLEIHTKTTCFAHRSTIWNKKTSWRSIIHKKKWTTNDLVTLLDGNIKLMKEKTNIQVFFFPFRKTTIATSCARFQSNCIKNTLSGFVVKKKRLFKIVGFCC